MFILHVALQGCLSSDPIPYGATSDTGGHIRYLLELAAEAEHAGVERQMIVTRRFEAPSLGSIYAQREDALSDTISIARIDGATPDYRSKEKLHTEHAELRASLFRFIERLDQKPDVIHAHYADAGYLAAEVKKVFAVPYIFTGHSLGRVKQATLTDDEQIEPDLEARIVTEERAIRDLSGRSSGR